MELRQLDAKLAEKLFGWTGVEKLVAGYANASIVEHAGIPLGKDSARIVPAYSASWAGAGEVVEAMKRRGWSVSLSTNGKPHAAFFQHVKLIGNVWRTGETVPECIALAALAAMEETHG